MLPASRRANGAARASLAALALAALASTPAHAANVEVGVLTCKVYGGVGFIFGSTKDIDCVLEGISGGKDRYHRLHRQVRARHRIHRAAPSSCGPCLRRPRISLPARSPANYGGGLRRGDGRAWRRRQRAARRLGNIRSRCSRLACQAQQGLNVGRRRLGAAAAPGG